MTEPTIPEILGWRQTAWWGWHRPPCDGDGWKDRCSCWPGPTADDMLAWLASKGRLLDSAWWDDLGQAPDYAGGFYVELSDPCLIDGRFPFGRTLHEAVEDAVRAVYNTKETR